MTPPTCLYHQFFPVEIFQISSHQKKIQFSLQKKDVTKKKREKIEREKKFPNTRSLDFQWKALAQSEREGEQALLSVLDKDRIKFRAFIGEKFSCVLRSRRVPHIELCLPPLFSREKITPQKTPPNLFGVGALSCSVTWGEVFH